MTKSNEDKQVRVKLNNGEIIIYSLIIPFMSLIIIVLALALAKIIKVDMHIAILILGMIFPIVLIVLAILKFTNCRYIFKDNYLVQVDAFITYKVEYSAVKAIIEDKEKNRIYVKYTTSKGEEATMWLRIDPKHITTVIGWFIEKCDSLDLEEIDKKVSE